MKHNLLQKHKKKTEGEEQKKREKRERRESKESKRVALTIRGYKPKVQLKKRGSNNNSRWVRQRQQSITHGSIDDKEERLLGQCYAFEDVGIPFTPEGVDDDLIQKLQGYYSTSSMGAL